VCQQLGPSGREDEQGSSIHNVVPGAGPGAADKSFGGKRSKASLGMGMYLRVDFREGNGIVAKTQDGQCLVHAGPADDVEKPVQRPLAVAHEVSPKKVRLCMNEVEG
jgi:hypothetical protein